MRPARSTISTQIEAHEVLLLSFSRPFLDVLKGASVNSSMSTNADPAHKSVCCAEVGHVWQKVEDQKPDIQMKCITEYPGFQSTYLDVWVHGAAYHINYAFRLQHGADNHTGNEYVYFYFNCRGSFIKLSIIKLTSAVTGFILIVH